MESGNSSDSAEKTILIDRTVVSGKTAPASSGKNAVKTGFGTGFFRKKRKDVDSRIEELREHHNPGNVNFSGDELKLDSLNDEYEVREKIAEGGQGLLFRGFDRRLHRLVAIKSLRKEAAENGELRRFFLSEARVTAQLDHPAIVPIYSLKSDGENGLHLAMKMINGITLKDYLKQVATHYRLDGVRAFDEEKSLRNRLEIFLKACDALEYAHSRNIMHRDLKPENIMTGEYHETYIMDWGIARPILPQPEGASVLAGTPQYLAPEAIRGEPCDQRADIFAMGAILFELVTLHPAFSGETPEEVMCAIRDGQMNPPEHEFGAKIDGDLKAVICKALANDPAERYQQAGELSADLRRWMMDLEVSAKPDNLLRKCFRWSRSHSRLLLLLFLTALLAGVSALSYSLFQSFRFSEEMRLRDNALSTAFSICSRAAYRLDEQFLKLEQATSLLAADTAFLLNYDLHEHSAGTAAVSLAEFPERKSDTMLRSRFHHGTIDPAVLVYTATPDTALPLKTRLEPLSRFIPRLRQIILESGNVAWTTEAQEKAFLEGTPVIRVLFGFPDGLYAAYPASGKFPRGYDPRLRRWYRIAEHAKQGTVWTEPYIDSIPEFGLVISCSAPIRLAGGTASGVCGLDISIAKLVEELRLGGNSEAVAEEKAIVTNTGDIIVSTGRDFAAGNLRGYRRADEKVVFTNLGDPVLLDRMNRKQYGVSIQRDVQGREFVYAFCRIRSVDWFYVEKMELKRLVASSEQRGVEPGQQNQQH